VTPRLPGVFSNYDAATNSLVVAGFGNNPMNLGRKTYYTDFAPRLGLSYRLDTKTVIRAGMGSVGFPSRTTSMPGRLPGEAKQHLQCPDSYGQAQSSAGVYGSMSAGFPAPQPAVIPSNGIIVANTPQLLSLVIAGSVPLDYREGYIQSWNFAVQRQLPRTSRSRPPMSATTRFGRRLITTSTPRGPSIPALPGVLYTNSSARTRMSACAMPDSATTTTASRSRLTGVSAAAS